MAHPLSGANLGTLAKVVGRSGLPSKPLSATAIGLAALARWPFSTAERLVMESRLPAAADLSAPVFILGHWRSGTTHLYNIMCKGEAWGFVPPVATGLPWDLFGLARVFNSVLERALPEHRYIDNIPVTPDSPQEDEIAVANMSDLSFYHGIYFPRTFADHIRRGLFFDGCSDDEIDKWKERFTYLLRKLYMYQDDKPLLIKNPVYTGRVALLREMFPQAKFIHIHRNPYEVFASMRNFYAKLLNQFALQNYEHVDIDETILSVYDRMMHTLERDTAGLPEDVYLEMRYDELDHRPMESVERIYSTLALPDFEMARPKFETYLASVESFKKNKFAYSDEAAAKVEGRWRYFVDKWGYERPGNTQDTSNEAGESEGIANDRGAKT